MARQQRKLPAQHRNAVDDSLLIRSAESLGRVIGTLQRQLDAARRLVGPATVDRRHNGHAPARQQSAVSVKPAAKRKTATKRTANGGKRSATKGRVSRSR